MMKEQSARLVVAKRDRTSIGESQAAVNSPSTEPDTSEIAAVLSLQTSTLS